MDDQPQFLEGQDLWIGIIRTYGYKGWFVDNVDESLLRPMDLSIPLLSINPQFRPS